MPCKNWGLPSIPPWASRSFWGLRSSLALTHMNPSWSIWVLFWGNHYSLSSFDASALWKYAHSFHLLCHLQYGVLGACHYLPIWTHHFRLSFTYFSCSGGNDSLGFRSEQQSCFVYDWLRHPYHHLVTRIVFSTSIHWVCLDYLFPLIIHHTQWLQPSIASMYSVVFPFSASVPSHFPSRNVCVCVYIHIYIHVCMYVCMHLCINI